MDENEEIENVMRSLSDVVGEKVNFDDGDIRVVGRSALINPANRGRFYFFFLPSGYGKRVALLHTVSCCGKPEC